MPEFLTQRNGEMTDVSCVKLLRYEVVCYTATDTNMPNKSIITLNGNHLDIAVERDCRTRLKKERSCSMLSTRKVF